MVDYSPIPISPYQFIDLETETSFRVVELHPGLRDAPISCSLRLADWKQPPDYEAVSYAWGNPNMKASIKCHGKRLEVGRNLHDGLTHLRLPLQSRLLWVDCLCMHQTNIRERNQQVRQMRRIYEKATRVLTWLGPDSSDHLAKSAVESIRLISDFLCERLNLQVTNLSTNTNVYHEVLYKNRHLLPSPDKCDPSSKVDWQALIWFYSHSYFSRLWIIQEINASTTRTIHCGQEQVEWDRVDIVAGYIIMDTAFSKTLGFSNTYCWWAATVTTERMRNPKNWLFMLYLASNFKCSDARDMIYGLRGLMHIPEATKQATLLSPDYDKSIIEVYQDSVDAALCDFQNTDVLLYLVGDESPSWIPRWDRPMLFRNPFRFGRALPWRPAGNSTPEWRIDQDLMILHLSGYVIDTVESVCSYNERYFSKTALKSSQGMEELQHVWRRILNILASCQDDSHPTIDTSLLTAAATALSFGLDADANLADRMLIVHNFVAYLSFILGPTTVQRYVSPNLSDSKTNQGDPHAFGKPVWDFAYPESGFFVTSSGLVGCSVCVPQRGDLVFAALGSTYPSIVRPQPDGLGYLIRGYAYVDKIMDGDSSMYGAIRILELH